MVSIVWGMIAASLGLLIYLLIPIGANSLPIDLRYKVGTAYLKMAARCLKQFTFVRRVLSGYDIFPIDVDNEQKLLKAALESGLVGGKREYQFTDPDNRVKRLYNKPVAVSYEEVPAAVDPELAEIGHWVAEHDTNYGLEREGRVDPYVPMSDGLRLSDPIDVFNIVTNSVDPENITTAEQLTKKRFEKYGSRLGMAETLGTIMGFAAGIGGVAMLQYFNQNILEGSGGTDASEIIPIGGIIDVSTLLDLLAVVA